MITSCAPRPFMRSYNPTPTRLSSSQAEHSRGASSSELFAARYELFAACSHFPQAGFEIGVRHRESHGMMPRVPLHLQAVLRHDDAQLELLPGLEVEILERCGQLNHFPPADGMVPVGLRKDLAGGGRVQPECAGLGAAQRED